MKTLKEFEQFLDSDRELAQILVSVDKKRKSNMKRIIIMFGFGLVFIALMMFFANRSTRIIGGGDLEYVETSNKIFYIIFGVFFVLSAIYSLYSVLKSKTGSAPTALKMDSFTFDFKDKVIRRIISFFDPSFRYEMTGFVHLSTIMQSGMFVDAGYDVTGSDLIRGAYNGVNFRFSDVTLIDTGILGLGGDKPDDIVFSGSFFIAEFNKKFKNAVYIYPRKTSISGLQREGEEVKLESPFFAKTFSVYSEDQIEARYILSTSLMARIENLVQLLGNQIHIIFANNNIYIANNDHNDRFETAWSQSINKRETLIHYYKELSEQLSLIDELKLNVKIWFE